MNGRDGQRKEVEAQALRRKKRKIVGFLWKKEETKADGQAGQGKALQKEKEAVDVFQAFLRRENRGTSIFAERRRWMARLAKGRLSKRRRRP